MNIKVREQRRGKNLQLTFAVIYNNKISDNKCMSKVFNIDDLAEARFNLTSGEYPKDIHVYMSLKKHESAKDFTIKVDVKSDVLKYSQRWMCTEHWVDWQKLGETTSNTSLESKYYLYVIPISITVIKQKSFIAENIYEDEDWTDFLLSARDGSVPVHKACLAAHSDVLKTMLSNEWKETTEGRIQIEGVTLQTLKYLKQYMYLGTLPDEELRPLLLLARCYLIDNLKNECISKLARTATSEDLEDLLNFAIDNKITELVLALLQLAPDHIIHGAYLLKKLPVAEQKEGE